MPFHKKSSSQNLKDDYQIRNRQYQHIQQQQQQDNKQEQDDEEEVDEVEGNEERGGEDSADQSPSSSADDDKDEDEYLYLDLAEFRKEVECPICLGIIRKTRTVMECLHRFCRDCIDKSMRLGNNECPACRTHCASRRSLRDDPNYDALIAALFPDIDKYEAEELAFGEEERTRNKNIQESITQTLRRQSEALGKKTTTTPVTRRRGRTRMNQTTNTEASEENIDRNGGSNSNGGGRGSSSSDEQYTDTKQKRVKRRTRRNSSPTSSTPADNNSEVNNENPFLASPAFPGSREVPTWGKGGTRSQTRNRMARGGNSKNTASNSELNSTNYLQTVDDQKHEV